MTRIADRLIYVRILADANNHPGDMTVVMFAMRVK